MNITERRILDEIIDINLEKEENGAYCLKGIIDFWKSELKFLKKKRKKK